jgi:hypothetical protein
MLDFACSEFNFEIFFEKLNDIFAFFSYNMKDTVEILPVFMYNNDRIVYLREKCSDRWTDWK